MRRLILLPLVAAALFVGCDGGVLGGGKIENYGGKANCYYQGGIKDTFAHGKGAVYCSVQGQGLVKMFENEFC
ncbi:MAG: hypothetical protein ACO3IZ_06945, partial [Steroidobacteraceae bacterium]